MADPWWQKTHERSGTIKGLHVAKNWPCCLDRGTWWEDRAVGGGGATKWSWQGGGCGRTVSSVCTEISWWVEVKRWCGAWTSGLSGLRVKAQWPTLCHTRVSGIGLKASLSGQSWNLALGQRSHSTGGDAETNSQAWRSRLFPTMQAAKGSASLFALPAHSQPYDLWGLV